MKKIVHYFDYKSPYAYLAQEETYKLAKNYRAEVEYIPLTLDIPSYFGRAELDEKGVDRIGERNPHQWRRVKYSYMDCRREATRRGMTILGPKKIFDSSVAHIGMLFAKERGNFWRYHELAFERFFLRKFDTGDTEAVKSLLEEVEIDSSEFDSYLNGSGRLSLEAFKSEADKIGVFGVPSYLVDGQLYWGAERLERVIEHLGN